MKNWNYITGAQIGNRTASEIEKEIAEVESSIDSYHRAGENPPKNLEDRLKRLQAELANAKTGNSTEKLFEGLSKDAEKEEEKSDEALDELKKTGNKETFEDFIKKLAKEKPDLYQSLWNAGKMEALKAYYNKITGNEKTGNSSVGGGVQSETVLTETKDGSQYWVEKTSKSGQYAQYNLYYTVGQGKRHAGVFKDKEAAADAGRRIIGNSSSNEEYWKKQYIETARKKGISEKEIQEFVKKIEKEGPKGVMSTIKNSASDDKFAYVMREFDEGKLKTPDGKVVTDPQQAKAIAYSESKKTENGLARARNAMAGNKEITLWSGNDSALVKSDGTVLYLESNSFETGRDKFDSQELAVKELAKNGYKPK